MDCRMAVRAAGIKCPGPLGGDAVALAGIDSVALMALEAQKWYTCVEKPAVD